MKQSLSTSLDRSTPLVKRDSLFIQFPIDGPWTSSSYKYAVMKTFGIPTILYVCT